MMLSSRASHYALGFALALLGLASPRAVHAQSASQITPHSFSPPLERNPAGGFDIGTLPALDTPSGAEALFVSLCSVEVAGTPSLPPATAALRAKLLNGRVSGAAIFEAARELEAAYARAGYVLVRVVLPPQQLNDGATLRLAVIDGYLERIETSAVPAAVRKRIDRVLAPLQGRRGIRLATLERHILLAGDTPGVILRSTLAPGNEPGAAVLIIQAKYQALDATVSADNSLSRALGGYQAGVGLDLNSVLHQAESLYVRVNGDPGGGDGMFTDHARNRSVGAGVIAPIGYDGATLNLEGTQARTTPEAAGASQASDEFRRVSLRVRYPWIRSRNLNLAGSLVFDVENEREDLIRPAVLPLFDDRLRVARLMHDLNGQNAVGGNYSGSFTMSYGFAALGARSAAAASPILPLSRQGAGANFAKVDGALGYDQSLTAHLSAELSARGQYAFGRALERSEQIGIADSTGLSAYDAGSVQGDSGVIVRAELSSPWLLPVRSQPIAILASPYVFAAVGEVYLADPTALEAAHVRGGSYGGGIRFGGGTAGRLSSASLTLEVAHQTGNFQDATRLRVFATFKY